MSLSSVSDETGHIGSIPRHDCLPDDDRTAAPRNIEELSTLLKKYDGQVAVIGSGNELSLPDGFTGLTISTSRLSGEPTVSIPNQTVIVEAGVAVQSVNELLRQHNLTVPALARFSRGTVGGRLASVSSRPAVGESDGWIQSLLGLDVVLPTGNIIKAGGECIKDVAGYDLRHMFTGCRGATGIIVRAIFRCRPLNSYPDSNKELEIKIGTVDPLIRKLFDPTLRMWTDQ